MWRYLRAAFWIRPEIPLLGRVPINFLALLGFGILGFGHPGFWLLGAACETTWLWAAVQSARFRLLIDVRELGALPAGESDGKALTAILGPESRQRLARLEEKASRVIELQRAGGRAEVLAELNREALDKLAGFAAKLLAARESLLALAAATDEAELQRRIAALERELAESVTPVSARESKEATLRILQQRLAHLDRREESLEEIESDLTRIEAQVDLAVDQAGARRRDLTVSTEIDFTSRFLDDPLSSDLPLPPPSSRTRETSRSRLPES